MIDFPLYPYQRDTVEFMKKGPCINASFCGSGKTIVSLVTIHELGFAKNIIVCPKSVLFNWANEINRWLPGYATPFVVSGSPKARKAIYKSFLEHSGTKYLIMTYDTLRVDIETFRFSVFGACVFGACVFGACVFDEVHYCVNIKSKRYKACKALQAKVKYGLTATPVMNSATDIFGCINVVKGPVLGNWFGFLYRYCNKNMWGSVTSFKNMEELKARVSPFIVRKTWEDAGYVPPPEPIDLEFELSKEETDLYNRIKSEMLFELKEIEVSKLSSPMILQQSLVKLGKLQELVDSCELIGEVTKSSKTETLKELLDNILVD